LLKAFLLIKVNLIQPLENAQIKHSWKLNYHEAVTIQDRLRLRVEIHPLSVERIRFLAAADISFSKQQPELYAAVLLFTFPELILVEHQTTIAQAEFPYIPGLLSFREAPVLLPLFLRLQQKPDVIFIDGQGIAHPRRFGLASHLGVLLETPTIGCAKSRLCGSYTSVPQHKGEWIPLRDGDVEIGWVLCTRTGVKPIFISVGHRVDLDSAIRIVMRTVSRYRIPEPIRAAHRLVNSMRVNQATEIRKK